MGGIRESTIEAYLRQRVKELGGKAYKFVSPGNDGVPDRMVCLPRGWSIFVELKAPGKKPTPQQRAKHRELRALGFIVFGCVDSREDVDAVIAFACGMGGDRDRFVEMEYYDHE